MGIKNRKILANYYRIKIVELIDLYPYDVIYVNKHSAQCIVGLFGGDAPPLLLTIEACNHYS